MRWMGWRALVERLAGLWRHSLQLRTVAITVVLSGLAVTVIGAYMSVSMGTNLFDARRDQLLATSETAVVAGQSVIDGAAEQLESEDIEVTMTAAAGAIERSAASGGEIAFAILRTPGDSGGPALPVVSAGFDQALLTDELRADIAASEDRRLRYQSVSLESDDGVDPGLMVGSTLDIAGSTYQLFIVYNLADAQRTLGFIQQTLALGGARARRAHRRRHLRRGAAGRAAGAGRRRDQRAARRRASSTCGSRCDGDDVIATLARSFNGMAASLQGQITRLAALSQVQQRFVSDVSHELRTPLTTIRLAGDVLYDQRETFPPATARTAELLHTQVERFEVLLADLLEMSRYDAGAVDMETESTNLVRLVEDAIESVRTLAASKGSDLRLVAPGGYFEAEVDARRIRRILLQPPGQRHRPRRGPADRGLRRQRRDRRRDRGARLRCRDGARRDEPRVRPVLAGRPVPPAHHRRHRARPRDLASRMPRCTAAGSRCGRRRGRGRASG